MTDQSAAPPPKPKRKGVKPPGAGRKKGTPNKTTAALKDMILSSLHGAGGVRYLIKVAKSHPQAYLPLLGRVLPLQVNANVTATTRTPQEQAIYDEQRRRVFQLLEDAYRTGAALDMTPKIEAKPGLNGVKPKTNGHGGNGSGNGHG